MTLSFKRRKDDKQITDFSINGRILGQIYGRRKHSPEPCNFKAIRPNFEIVLANHDNVYWTSTYNGAKQLAQELCYGIVE